MDRYASLTRRINLLFTQNFYFICLFFFFVHVHFSFTGDTTPTVGSAYTNKVLVFFPMFRQENQNEQPKSTRKESETVQ